MGAKQSPRLCTGERLLPAGADSEVRRSASHQDQAFGAGALVSGRTGNVRQGGKRTFGVANGTHAIQCIPPILPGRPLTGAPGELGWDDGVCWCF